MGEKLSQNGQKRTLLERYLANEATGTELPGRVQRSADSGETSDPMWYIGQTGLAAEDILDAPQEEVDELKAYLGIE